MAQLIQLKRSNTAGAIPSTTQLQFGEVAINTADGKIYIRKYVDGTTTNDLIVELNPAPEGQGLQVSSSAAAPTSPKEGQIWFDTAANVLKTWDGFKWVSVGSTRSDTQPADAQAGDLWYDSDISKMFLYDGANWTGVGGGATVSDNAPANAQTGDLWFDEDNLRLFMYYDTGTDQYWIEMHSLETSGLILIAKPSTSMTTQATGTKSRVLTLRSPHTNTLQHLDRQHSVEVTITGLHWL